MAATFKLAYPLAGPLAWKLTGRPKWRGGGGAAPFAGILDQLSTSPSGAWSMSRALLASYVGSPLIRLRRVSDNAESDFGVDANGDLDTASIATWIGGSSAAIAKVYDQSGSGIDMVQATAGIQPLYMAAAVGGRPGFTANPTNSYMRYSGSALDDLPSGGFSCHAVGRTSAGGAPTTLFGRKNWAGNGWRFFSSSGQVSITDNGGTARNWTVANQSNAADYAEGFNYDGTFNNGAVVYRRNGASLTVTNPGAGSAPPISDAGQQLWWNQGGGSGASDWRQTEMVLFASALSSGDLQTLNDNCVDYYGL